MGKGQPNTRQPGRRHEMSWLRRLVLVIVAATLCVAGIDVASATPATTISITVYDSSTQHPSATLAGVRAIVTDHRLGVGRHDDTAGALPVTQPDVVVADSGGALARLKAVASGDRGAIGREAQIGGEAANYGNDELAQFAYQHSGQGYANGEVRPSFDEIHATISSGVRSRLPNQNAIRIQTPGVRVIINEDQPWLSTAYYR